MNATSKLVLAALAAGLCIVSPTARCETDLGGMLPPDGPRIAYLPIPFPLGELPRAAARAAWAGRAARPADRSVVGYEYGLQLYVLADAADPECDREAMLAELLALRHSAGVWAEYYRGGRASERNCPYRPWESAINLCGILRYLEHERQA